MWACVVAGLESEQFTAVDGRPVIGYGLQVWDDMRDELAQMQEMGIEPRIPS